MSHSEISVIIPIRTSELLLTFNENNEDTSVLVQSLENLLSELLKSQLISYPIWTVDLNEAFKQVSFFTKSGADNDTVLTKLEVHGLGVKMNSAVRIIPCTLICDSGKAQATQEKAKVEESSPRSTNAGWDGFVQSLEPFVAEVFQSVRRQTVFTLDFCALLTVAALVLTHSLNAYLLTASLGLMDNSTVILVASMLISPMMGPVMAVLFGTLTSTRKLQKLGICNGLSAVLLCIVIGFLFGCILLLLQTKWPIGDFPTPEMISRGELKSLWVGMITALLAGIAIATATLNDRWHDSIIGVAISVALLPPAVNAGLLWSMAVASNLHPAHDKFPNNYQAEWSHYPSLEYASLGGISLGLTFINIISIFVKNFQLKQNEKFHWNHLYVGTDFRNFDGEENKLLDERIGDSINEQSAGRRWSFGNCLSHANEISYRNLHTWTAGNNPWTFESRPSALDLAIRLAQGGVLGSCRGHKWHGPDINTMTPVSEMSNEQASRFKVFQTPADDISNNL
ncbi:uncharacterized protein isoform X2 [Rhodnius prolixus]|uniref:uncharacterized protein isoform X2 n=1 Tax=Rhodnius prolixus TaxID=13249 RepID=UPI003D18B6CE